MATGIRVNVVESNGHNVPLDNLNCLSQDRYLESYTPLSKARPHNVPLGLRRSVSFEENAFDMNSYLLQKPKEQNSSPYSALSSSLNSLCVKIRSHQLLPEYNENIARSADEHDFNWWKTAAYLRPLFEKVILYEKLTNEFVENDDEEDQILSRFNKCKRKGRRHGVCIALDKLCYNEQLILFATISHEVQIEYNLMSSGFSV